MREKRGCSCLRRDDPQLVPLPIYAALWTPEAEKMVKAMVEDGVPPSVKRVALGAKPLYDETMLHSRIKLLGQVASCIVSSQAESPGTFSVVSK